MEPSAAISFPVDAHNQLLLAEKGAWFQYRNDVIVDLIRNNPFQGEFYEIGAGNGVVSKHLQDLGYSVTAVEPVASGAANCLIHGIRNVKESTLEGLELNNETVSAIGAFDVIEHLSKPDLFLREAHRILKPGGMFYVSVPAHQFLWSSVDKHSGHFKRYARRDLINLFEDAGFETLECKFFMNLLMPPAFILRVLPEWLGKEPDELTSLSNSRSVLEKSFSMEICLGLEKKLRLNRFLPFGTSLSAAFRKI